MPALFLALRIQFIEKAYYIPGVNKNLISAITRFMNIKNVATLGG